MNRARELRLRIRKLWTPPPRWTLSEWAEQNFVLSAEYSAVTGKLTLYKFQREPLDSFTDPYTREVVIMSATQMLKTLTLQCALAYTMAVDPGPVLLAQPTDHAAKDFSKERIDPMIRDIPALRGVSAEKKSRDKSNTILKKVFRGGSLSIVGAQSADNFARRSIKVFLADERDKWPANVGKEGDGFSLGVKRGATFRSRFKIVQTCSPTLEGQSQIAAAYERSDQRKFFVPCPHCGDEQVLAWERVTWDPGQPETAKYKCSACDQLWSDVERWTACESGEWRATRPFHGVAGYWISELYSPWKKLSDLAFDFLAKKDDPSAFQTFVNTSLAETWREQGEAPDHEKLMARREKSYRLGDVPAGVLFLTAGFDTQKTWLEGYVWGWGRGKQRWVVDHHRIERSPFQPEAWEEMTEILNRTYRHPSGTDMSLVRLAVDAGFATNEVYAWSRQQGSSRVMAIDGRSTGASIVGTPAQVDVTVGGKKIKHGCKLWPVNVSMCKSELYGLLGKDRPADGEPYPAGWVHFPEDLDQEFFQQLTAEQLTTKFSKGYRKTEWIKVRERNEALDCTNYARAGAAAFGMDRFSEHKWRELERQLSIVTEPEPPPPAPKVEQTRPTPLPVAQPAQPQLGAMRHQPGGWFGDRGRGWFDR